MSTFNKYLVIPFKDDGRTFYGVDCYGLVCLIYNIELGVVLNNLLEISEYRKKLEKGESHIIHRITQSWKRVKFPYKKYDLHIFRDEEDIAAHIGVNIGNNKFLHCLEDRGVEVGKLSVWNKKLDLTLRYNNA